jgi:hypothetical protein
MTYPLLDSARLVWFGPACVGVLLAGIPILFFMGRKLARCCG